MLQQHRSWRRLAAPVVAAVAAGWLALAVAPAHAEEAKSERAAGKLVSYDASAQTVVVKEKGKDQAYQVKAEGTVLTRTTLTMNGKVAKFDELKPGMIVIVYWKPDASDASKRYARKIDVPKIPKEFQEDVDNADAGQPGSSDAGQ